MTPEQEIRAKALELAIRALSRDASSAEYEDLAEEFVEYIASNAGEPIELGFYLDKDGERWERTAECWYFREARGVGFRESWKDIKHYGPFTKIEE